MKYFLCETPSAAVTGGLVISMVVAMAVSMVVAVIVAVVVTMVVAYLSYASCFDMRFFVAGSMGGALPKNFTN